MGYHFTPLASGEITRLGGYFFGTKTVYLWNKDTGALLSQASVTSSNAWSFTDISPVSVTAGTNYVVAAYLGGSGASYRTDITALPRTYGDIIITASAFKTGNGMPLNLRDTKMYGQADIYFTPTGGAINYPPEITSSPVTVGTVGEAYSYDVEAEDINGDTLTYALTTAPSGMTINSSTGLISWTPAAPQEGLNPVTVSVTDGNGGEDTQSFSVNVAAVGGQTPWVSNENGTLYTDRNWTYTLGYHFTPQVNGQITRLGGFFLGTKTVYLWRTDTRELLRQIDISSNYNWNFVDITPVDVQAGVQYTVAAYLAGSGACYRYPTNLFPQTYGDIRIDASCFLTGYGFPTNTRNNRMYGMVDIYFVAE
jgi:hypothetical protein